ncbi:MAG TPA: DUF4827 family protein [Muribaculum sp.]|mgnify:FL=1|jgi:hypothetical protein|uniref:DUF4827 family protein n=1 Tax=Heminiphilus faecis TaxID=2601703 RepID=A0ABV4CX28_9BACT|nr:DUF4827 family protein [Heminiphilus faecis]RLT75530.1 DUF4827 family protein [bacterium J10(2018)]HRF68899.1 DUF4827 family protein [Muribaculum sp.]
MKSLRNLFISLCTITAVSILATGCNDSKSYADLLNEETKSINNYLADQKVINEVPADSVFITRQEIAEKMLQQQSVSPNSPDYDTKLGDALQYLKEHPGEDAPYYRMDGDGNVYMRVINNGNMDKRPKVNDLVFLRFTRFNLSYYKDKTLPSGDGNAEDVSISESIRYQNFSSTNTSAWGEGIQVPLGYLGYNCEVQIVIRSQVGRSDEIAVVIPYMYTIRYYKSQI